MAKYLLDTNIIISIINNELPDLIGNLKALPPTDFAVSVITYSELVYGYEKLDKDERAKKQAIVNLALSVFTMLDYDKKCSDTYGKIKADLANRKVFNPKNELDIQIAATSIAHHLVLLTKNEKDFKDIAGIRLQTDL